MIPYPNNQLCRQGRARRGILPGGYLQIYKSPERHYDYRPPKHSPRHQATAMFSKRLVTGMPLRPSFRSAPFHLNP